MRIFIPVMIVAFCAVAFVMYTALPSSASPKSSFSDLATPSGGSTPFESSTTTTRVTVGVNSGGGQTQHVTLVVSDLGFNYSRPFAIIVKLNFTATITFIYHSESTESCQVYLAGYDVEGPYLTPLQSRYTMTFRASQAGDFQLSCNDPTPEGSLFDTMTVTVS